MTRALLLLLALLASPAFAAENPTKDADDKLKKLVNEAIDRGSKWLAKQQKPDGSFPSMYAASFPRGPTALATLTLLHCGADPKSEAITKAFEALRRAERATGEGGRHTYSVSVLVMALAEYGRALGAPRGKFQLPPEDRKWLEELTQWLVKTQTPRGVWHYPFGGSYDHSNSQYALLALKEARRAGVRVDPGVFERALLHFLKAQEKYGPRVPRYEEVGGDGVYARNRRRLPGSDRARGWGYTAGMTATGSMTAAGVAAVAICAGELHGDRWKDLREKALTARRDGIAWLGKNFEAKHNPKVGATWHHYYLYGLERAGVLSGVVWMGNHRWYAEGAKFLVDSQSPDGTWRTAHSPRQGGVDIIDPCFALLFLVRATARSFGVVTERNLLNLTEADKLSDADLANVFQAAFEELATLEGDALADRASDFAFCGPRVVPLLIKKLAAAEEAARARALLVLKTITGQPFEGDDAMDRYTAWWLMNRKKLALDRPAKLIR